MNKIMLNACIHTHTQWNDNMMFFQRDIGHTEKERERMEIELVFVCC